MAARGVEAVAADALRDAAEAEPPSDLLEDWCPAACSHRSAEEAIMRAAGAALGATAIRAARSREAAASRVARSRKA